MKGICHGESIAMYAALQHTDVFNKFRDDSPKRLHAPHMLHSAITHKTSVCLIKTPSPFDLLGALSRACSL
jgi:hypothetical protein